MRNKWVSFVTCNVTLFFLLIQVLICGTFKGMKIKPGSMGKPSPAFDVKVCIYLSRIVSRPICLPPTRLLPAFTLLVLVIMSRDCHVLASMEKWRWSRNISLLVSSVFAEQLHKPSSSKYFINQTPPNFQKEPRRHVMTVEPFYR